MRTKTLIASAIFCILFAAISLAVERVSEASRQSKQPWKFEDTQSKVHNPFDDEKTKAVVLVFVTTDCPIANYYQPTLTTLTKQFAKKGIPFFQLHADPEAKVDVLRKHADEYKIAAPVIHDRDQVFAKRVGARVTPEAFLISRKGEIVYRGRIDDLYADFGKRRRVPRNHDLRDAIEHFVDGKDIKKSKTRAVGCYIPYRTRKN